MPAPRSFLPLALAATLALGACGGNDDDKAAAADPKPAASGPTTVAVSEAEFSLKPATAEAPAGKVTFDVADEGKIKHEFVVIRTDKKADALLKGDEADETGAVDEIGDIEPGKDAKLTLNLKAGHYALICNLPGHYMPDGKPGMLADFTVS
jgi:uncharacterized cupredoxin-like copper-binding protein